MTTIDAAYLYRLLPLIYRRRDHEYGEPLRALLAILGEEYVRIHDDIGRLYDDWFIASCRPEVIPLIGDLVGVPRAEVATALPGRRAVVANAIRYRRRKGIVAVLERAASTASGWAVRATLARRDLAVTAHLDHLRHGEAGVRPHTVDVRAPVRTGEARGLHNLAGLTVDVCRLQALPIEHAEPAPIADGCFTFDPLGRDVPLFQLPIPDGDLLDARDARHLPTAIDPHEFARAPGAWLDEARGLAIARDGVAATGRDVVAAALEPWHRPGPSTTGLVSARLVAGGHLTAAAPQLSARIGGLASVLHLPTAIDPHEFARAPGAWLDEARGLAIARDGVAATGRDVVAAALEPWHRPGPSTTGLVSARLVAGGHLTAAAPQLSARIGGLASVLHLPAGLALADAAPALETALRRGGDEPGFRAARVLRVDDRLIVVPGAITAEAPVLGFTAGDRTTALELGVALGARAAVLRSPPLDPADHDRSGRVRLVLGDTAHEVAIAAAPTVTALAHELTIALRPLGWRALADGTMLVVVAPAAARDHHLRAETAGGDADTVYRLGLAGRVAVDVERGRLACPLGGPHEPSLRVSWCAGRAADLGAGPYPRPPRPGTGWTARVRAGATAPWFGSLADAIAAWRAAGAAGRIRIEDSARHGGDQPIAIAIDRHALIIEAAPGEVPALPGGVRVDATGPGRLVLDGLVVGNDLHLDGPAHAELAHASLPRVTAAADGFVIAIHRSTVGPIALGGRGELRVTDSIVDGGGGPAIDGGRGAALHLARTTAIGAVAAEVVVEARDCLFTGALDVRRVQASRIVTSAVPWSARALPRLGGVLHGAPDAEAGDHAVAERPRLRSLAPGDPSYARLDDDGAPAIARAGTGGEEAGAYHANADAERRRLLERAIEDFLPAGLIAGIEYVN